MNNTRWAAALTALAVGPATALAVAVPAAAETPSTAVTALDQSAIAQYYQSKKIIGLGTQPAAVNTTSVQASASVGSAYLQDFYAAYADDPDVTIKGLNITPTVLSKTVTGSLVDYTVSVRVSFQLHDNSDGSDFTGGETVDHVVHTSTTKPTAVTDPTTSAVGTSTKSTILSDAALDVSTLTPDVVSGDAEDAQLAKMSTTTPLPDWQVKKKQTNNDPAGKGASTVAADGETGGSTASENSIEAADLAKTPLAADDDAGAAATNSVDSADRAASTNYFPQLRWRDAANYASLWTDDDHANKLNSKYGDAGDNCTNFVSQALYAGGWKTRNTTYAGRKWKSRWHWNYRGPGRFTYTWSRAHYNYRRVLSVGNRPTFSNINDAGLADIGYFDWDVGGATADDQQMDHVMIVTKITKKHPYFSQKSGNRHNVPPSEVRKNIGNHTFTFYGIRT